MNEMSFSYIEFINELLEIIVPHLDAHWQVYIILPEK